MSISEWSASVWVAAALGPIAGVLVYGFIRDHRGRSLLGILAAGALHLVFALLVPKHEPAPKGPTLVEIELLEPEPVERPELPPPVEAPEPPEPEPKEAPEPPKELKKVKTPKPRKPRVKRVEKPTPEPEAKPAGPKRFDASQLNTGKGSGIKVLSGSLGGSTLEGDPNNRNKDRTPGRKTGQGQGQGPGR